LAKRQKSVGKINFPKAFGLLDEQHKTASPLKLGKRMNSVHIYGGILPLKGDS
jgi:hypothetical protein